MTNLISVKDKVIIITGGYGYLGSTTAEALANSGAKVYVLGKDSNKFEKRFNNQKGIFFRFFDLADIESIKSSFKYIYEKEGQIDVLINNAFYLKGNSPDKMSDEDFSFGIEGTLNTLFSCIREIIPFFRKLDKGKIINISSMYGMVAPEFSIYDDYPNFLNPPHYGAAKAGVLQLTKYYASYLGKENITVNCVSPGPFPSENVQLEEGFVNKLKENTLLKRIGKPEDLVGMFILLSSDASNFITGQNLIIDGGWTVK